jgi:hypothetical protein
VVISIVAWPSSSCTTFIAARHDELIPCLRHQLVVEDLVNAVCGRARAEPGSIVPAGERLTGDPQFLGEQPGARVRPDVARALPGAVKGVQVEVPVILHKGGITGSIEGVVGALRFPAST